MAKAKSRTSTKASAIRNEPEVPGGASVANLPLPARLRVASSSVDAAIGGALASAVAKLGDGTALASTARGLVSGQITLQSVIGSLVQGASQAVESANKEAARTASDEALISRHLGADLRRLKLNTALPRPRKDDYVVRGQVAYASGEPAAGLVVEAIASDGSRNQAFGAGVTDDKGAFQLLLRKDVLAEAGERIPEILLVVGVEGQPPLHVTRPTQLTEGERITTVSIALPGDVSVATVPAGPNADIDGRLHRLEYRKAIADMQHQQLSTLLKEAQSTLAGLLGVMQPGPHPRAAQAAPQRKDKR